MITRNRGVRSRVYILVPGILFLTSAFLAPRPATAQTAGQPHDRVKVLGHLELPRMHVNQMFLQQRGEKYYLYLHRPNKQAFALVDVTKPEKPVLLQRAALEDLAGARLEMVRSESDIAVSVAPESPASENAASKTSPAPPVKLPAETVRLIDFSNPENPKTVKTFTGVTSMLSDENRRLIFIVNGEGLWIVLHREEQVAASCDSSAAIMIQPHCQ